MTDTPIDQDVVDLLTTDHHEVLDLVQQIKITTDAEERRDLADTIISELVRHSVAEEMYVYPAMRKYLPDGEQRDHMADEEGDQFPQLRAQVPRDELVEIGRKVETAKKLAPTRPHPMAPNNQLFHKLVGPGVGLVDRLRDKLTDRSS